jgi:hypothetical protein
MLKVPDVEGMTVVEACEKPGKGELRAGVGHWKKWNQCYMIHVPEGLSVGLQMAPLTRCYIAEVAGPD